jgi:hypothetical protein
MRFGLKSLFSIVFAAAVFLFVGRTAGYWVTCGTTVGLCVVWWAIGSRLRGPWIVLRLATGIVGIIAVWFLAVDWSWFVESCPDCRLIRDTAQYRVLGFPIWTDVDDSHTVFDAVLADLGVPCTHDHMEAERWHKHRWWGLAVCASPCVNGIYGLTDSGWRIQFVLKRMRERAEGDPEFGQILHERVIDHHDYDFFWQFVGDIPDEDPEPTAKP